MCAKQFISIAAMFMFMNVVTAQNFLIANNSSTSQSDHFSDLSVLMEEDVDPTEISKDVYFNVPEQVSQYDFATKSFAISGEVNYSKAELLDKVTNKTIKSVKLMDSSKSIDMKDVPTGSYYLILTSDAGEVHSEKIVVL